MVRYNNAEVNDSVEMLVSGIAAAIGEPARAKILYCLLDGHARTSTELSVVAEVSPSTASDHLSRLKSQGLVSVRAQGKHRYYSLDGCNVAAALEALTVVAGAPTPNFSPSTPVSLRAARTCYDHMAGRLAVMCHDRFHELHWLTAESGDGGYAITELGHSALDSLGIDVNAVRALRRRFAYPCLDWSERRPHLGGALAAAFLKAALQKRWFIQDLSSRVLAITLLGRREMQARFGLRI